MLTHQPSIIICKESIDLLFPSYDIFLDIPSAHQIGDAEQQAMMLQYIRFINYCCNSFNLQMT